MKKLVTKFDIIIIAVLLVSAVALFALKPREQGSTVIVTVDGKEYATLELFGEKTELTVNGVKIICGEGEAYIESSPCHDKICIKAGHISKKGQSAVCAPQRVALRISGEDKTKPMAVTG